MTTLRFVDKMHTYLDLKAQYEGYLLFFREGDYYNLFNEDAHIGARLLGLTITLRRLADGNVVYMSSIPTFILSEFLEKLIEKKEPTAVCEIAVPEAAVRILVPLHENEKLEIENDSQ